MDEYHLLAAVKLPYTKKEVFPATVTHKKVLLGKKDEPKKGGRPKKVLIF